MNGGFSWAQGVADDRPANLSHEGQMPRWATPSATVASFATVTVGNGRRIYVPLATAAAAGAQSAVDKAKLDALARPTLRLGYVAAADLLNGVTLTAATWTDVTPAQNFTVTGTTSFMHFSVRLGLVVLSTANAFQANTRLLFGDGRTVLLNHASANANDRASLGSASFHLDGFAAGTNTAMIQVYASTASNQAFCRPATVTTEFATIQVVELAP